MFQAITNSILAKAMLPTKKMLENWSFFSDSGWNRIDINNISGDWLNILDNIIDFCDEKGIKLTLVSAPMPSFRSGCIRKLLIDYIEFYSGNYCG